MEQIEAQAAAVAAAEVAVFEDLAAWLRTVAVELPAGSRMPLQFAAAAKTVDMFAGTISARSGLDIAIRELRPE